MAPIPEEFSLMWSFSIFFLIPAKDIWQISGDFFQLSNGEVLLVSSGLRQITWLNTFNTWDTPLKKNVRSTTKSPIPICQ